MSEIRYTVRCSYEGLITDANIGDSYGLGIEETCLRLQDYEDALKKISGEHQGAFPSIKLREIATEVLKTHE